MKSIHENRANVKVISERILKGWPAVIVLAIAVAAVIVFRLGFFNTPTSKEIMEKAGSQIISAIKAQVISDQSKIIETTEEKHPDKTSTILNRNIKALDNIRIAGIAVRKYEKESFLLHRLFKRSTRFLIKVDYILGDSKTPRLIILELNTPVVASWNVLPSSMPF